MDHKNHESTNLVDVEMNNDEYDTDNQQEFYKFGVDAVEQITEEARTRVAWQKREIEKSAAPKVTRLKVREKQLIGRRNEVQAIIRQAPQGSLTSLRLTRNLHIALAAIFVACGILFAHMALSPFGLGWETWGFSFAVGLVAMFWVDQTLDECGARRFIQALCIISLTGSLFGLLILAIVRGDILALYLQTELSPDRATSGAASEVATHFYAMGVWKLQALFALLAVGMELGSGMALHRVRSMHLGAYKASEDARKERAAIDDELANIAEALKMYEEAPELYEARCMSTFHRGLADRIRRLGLKYISIVPLLLCFIICAQRINAQSSDIVVALDLTRSMAEPSYDGMTDAAKSVQALEQLALNLPSGARLTILGITDQSFSRPWVLLARDLPSEHGPLQFVDQVDMSRRRLAADVRRLKEIKPVYLQTDIFGVLAVASDLFSRERQRRKVLVLYSDLRHSAGLVNIEKPPIVPVAETLLRVKRQGLLADLRDIDVYAYGVHAAGKDVQYWESLRRFWVAYFKEGGAALKAFSLASEAPQLDESKPQLVGRR